MLAIGVLLLERGCGMTGNISRQHPRQNQIRRTSENLLAGGHPPRRGLGMTARITQPRPIPKQTIAGLEGSNSLGLPPKNECETPGNIIQPHQLLKLIPKTLGSLLKRDLLRKDGSGTKGHVRSPVTIGELHHQREGAPISTSENTLPRRIQERKNLKKEVSSSAALPALSSSTYFAGPSLG